MFVFYNNIISGEADEKLLRAEVVVNFLELISSLGIRPHDLLVTYFGGGCVRGRHFGADDEVARLWRGGGVPEDRVVPVCGAANFTNVDREGEPAGPRCEVFWCSAAESPIEIGTVVFEKFLIGNVAQGLIPSNGLVYGGAIGLERLQGVLSGATTLFELPEIRPMVKRVEDSIPRQLRAIHLPSTRELVDGVLTLVALMSQVHEPLSGGRAARLRRIGRRCQRSLGSLGITEPNLLIYDLIIQAMEAQCLSGRRDLQERVIRLICV
jgi:alanyl-tRNA synthetase